MSPLLVVPQKVSVADLTQPIAAGEPHFSSEPRTTEELREQIAHVCLQNELLMSWWDAHGDKIRAAGGLAASRVHDCFIDAVCEGRSLARQAGIKLDQDFIKNYDWHPVSNILPAPEVGPAPGLIYTGGTLGLGIDEFKIEIDAQAQHCRYSLNIEDALFNIDKFAEPGRSRLLLQVGFHFGVDLLAAA